MSCKVRKHTFGYVLSAKIQISLRIQASSMGAFRVTKNAKFLHADNEDSNQTARCTVWLESSLGANVRWRFLTSWIIDRSSKNNGYYDKLWKMQPVAVWNVDLYETVQSHNPARFHAFKEPLLYKCVAKTLSGFQLQEAQDDLGLYCYFYYNCVITWENIPSEMCVHWKLKSVCASTESTLSLRFPQEETLYPWLSKMRTVKILIRIDTGWSESSLGAHIQRYVFLL